MNVLRSCTTSLFVGHAQCCLYTLSARPCTPACIHSNTHTRTKYVSCCILATGKVITERAKELACCRAADLIPGRERERKKRRQEIFHCGAQHGSPDAARCIFESIKWAVFALLNRPVIVIFIPQNVCLSAFI